jgi:outer membrane protein assembly factor BamD
MNKGGKLFILMLVSIATLSSCGQFNSIVKSADYSYRYEAAKQYYADGKYTKAVVLLQDVIAQLKGTDKGEESLYLLGLSAYKARDYESAANFLKKYYETYNNGLYTLDARYYNAMAMYKRTPEPKLDQTETYEAVTAFQNMLELYPQSQYSKQAQDMIFKLQDKLVEKEYLNAKTYYDLGSYFYNCSFGGNNYEACIITAENAMRDYPYSKRREDFAIMLLRAKYLLATHSVEARKQERMDAAKEEYYAFSGEFPESSYMPEAKDIYYKITGQKADAKAEPSEPKSGKDSTTVK